MTGLLMAVFSVNVHAQISQGGQPYSFSHRLEMPRVLSPDRTELQYKNLVENKSCSALEFARFLPLNEPLSSKHWQIISDEDGRTLYRIAIQSEGALAIGAYFNDFYLPPGSRLFIYSPDKKQLIGAFTSQNNHSSGLFATEYILGDELVIEYEEPIAVQGQGHFTISEILYAYRDVRLFSEEKGYGGSGDCEVNVNCPEGNGKKNQRDAVLRLLIKNGSSGTWCTGSLVNNTKEDRTPYVITADHCGKNSSADDHEQWVFYFHYQSWGCANPENEPAHKTMEGCIEIAASSKADVQGSDFYLVQLLQDIPETYNPYFLGWNRDGLGSSEGFTIHHPQGDIKKISHYAQDLQDASYAQGFPKAYWEVLWSETSTGFGVTEPGSSGSPLFDNDGYLIGTLTGGGASCSTQTAPDYYGKFSEHWMSNGDADDQQLRPWLDPLNLGVDKMDGIYMGVDEQKLVANQLFQAIPNPATSYLNVYFNQKAGNFHIQISDLSGSRIKEYDVSGNASYRIDMSKFSRGVYIVSVTEGKTIQYQKVTKL
jgi:hypothetical protein